MHFSQDIKFLGILADFIIRWFYQEMKKQILFSFSWQKKQIAFLFFLEK